MNVPNHGKVPFKDMTPEERSAIVEAWLISAGVEVFQHHQEKWIALDVNNGIAGLNAYRTRQRQLVIPWEHIKPEYKWAAMRKDGVIVTSSQKLIRCQEGWKVNATGTPNKFQFLSALNINTTGIDWRDSLVQRPEGNEQ